jgi:hypothetical protein
MIAFQAYANQPEDAIPGEDVFLKKIQKDSFQYFLEYANPDTGLVLDSSSPGSPSSIAATGFGLAALSIGQHQGWISYDEAYERILKTLHTLEVAPHEKGFFYHFLDPKTAKRAWGSEASSIDTALLLAGALIAAQYFENTEIETIAHHLYERVEWPWMMNGREVMCMGWTPEAGFLPHYWDAYSEHLILLALAIGSPTYPISPDSWRDWSRFEGEYGGKEIIYSHTGSLFTYQFAQAFIDFKKINDHGLNYFQNSRKATLANREFCEDNVLRFTGYGDNSGGLTACLGPTGYKAYGAKPGTANHDGTVAPYGAAASVVFTPHFSIQALHYYYETYGDKLYGPYGFKDSFNLDKNWFSNDYLGIDQGVTILMIENYLTKGVWNRFMQLSLVQKWVSACELNEPRKKRPRHTSVTPVEEVKSETFVNEKQPLS